jgi:diguanylate cyclase (GGDEF)-like protein
LLLLGGVGWLEDRHLGQDYAALLQQQQDTLTETIADDLDDRLAMHLAVLDRTAREVRVARLGGDEFAVLLADVRTLANEERAAGKVLSAAPEPFHLVQLTLRVGASIGLALWQPGDGDGSLLAQRADAMLYRAKQGGHGRSVSTSALH